MACQQFVEVARPKLFHRRNDKSLEIGTKSIRKIYLGDHATEHVRHLENIYNMLQEKRVPNVDRLTHSFDTTVYLEPKGVGVQPSNENEILEAIICVLQALTVSIPSKFHDVDVVKVYHRCSMKHLPYSTEIFDGLTLSGGLMTTLSGFSSTGRMLQRSTPRLRRICHRRLTPLEFLLITTEVKWIYGVSEG
jgi:hypothetical protein